MLTSAIRGFEDEEIRLIRESGIIRPGIRERKLGVASVTAEEDIFSSGSYHDLCCRCGDQVSGIEHAECWAVVYAIMGENPMDMS